MKKVKLVSNPVGWILLFIAFAIVLSFSGCDDSKPTVGQEICAVVCKKIGGKFYFSTGHMCLCEFEMPHYDSPEALSSDQPKGSSL